MAGNSNIGLVQACSLRMCARILPDALHQAVFVEAFSLGDFSHQIIQRSKISNQPRLLRAGVSLRSAIKDPLAFAPLGLQLFGYSYIGRCPMLMLDAPLGLG